MSFQPTTACVNAPSRRLFAPMFRARWQNMQNIVNDSVFYDMVPEPYLTYYQAFIRQWIQWSQGFVPALHRQDFFSTGMGYTVCDIFAKQCMSGGYRFHSQNPEAKAALKLWDGGRLETVFSEMFFFSNAGGNSILCLTPIDGEVYPSAIPINRLYFMIGRRGEVTQAIIFNRFVAGETAYYARESRMQLDGRGYYRVELVPGTLVTSPSFVTAPCREVPDKIRGQWEYAYGNIVPGVWYELPKSFHSLGLYNIRNKSVAVAIADLPGYSDSTLHTALDVLYSIDYNYTQGQVDQYMGKSRALIPKQFQTAPIRGGGVGIRKAVEEGVSFVEAINMRGPELNDEFYTQVESGDMNGTPIKPTFLQPDLRGEARKYIRDSDLELLASKVGLSATTLANHLAAGATKTATQVRSEVSETESSVNNKRELAKASINRMLNDVLNFYGFADKVEISWGRSGMNSSVENSELLKDYQAGTMPIRMYLQKRWPDMSEEEIERTAREIEEEKRQEAALGAEQDFFGAGE